MAAMPSVGRIQKLSVLGIAAATLGVPATSASAQGAVDGVGPEFAVGGYSSPAAGVKNLEIVGTDSGTGLRYAQAWLQGGPVTPVDTARFTGDQSSPREACNGLDKSGRPVSVPLDRECVHVGKAVVPLDTKAVADNPNQVLTVRAVDWAGNATVKTLPIYILNNVDLGSPTQTLSIGTSGIAPLPAPPAVPGPSGDTGGAGGVAGSSRQQCASPRLSFALAQKPMRVTKGGTPVLQYGKRYRFEGRLTCVVNGKRRSAPKRARVDIFNRIHKSKRLLEKRGTTVGNRGRLRIILAYKSSRTIIFRFTNSDGRRDQVSIRVKVERKKKSRR